MNEISPQDFIFGFFIIMITTDASMWSLGKVLGTPEVARVYIGSFWDEPYKFAENRKLFESEAQDLFSDLQCLPKHAMTRKLNDLIKRARLAKVHALIIHTLQSKMPAVFGKEKKKQELIENLKDVYDEVSQKYSISLGDFPNIEQMKEKLAFVDWSKFRAIDKGLLSNVQRMLSKEVPVLMQYIRQDEAKKVEQNQDGVHGGLLDLYNKKMSVKEYTPFGDANYAQGFNAGIDEEAWVVTKSRNEYDRIFNSLQPVNGTLSGVKVKNELVKSNLPNTQLSLIWKLASLNKTSSLNIDEFALAMHLVKQKLAGFELPKELPDHLVPPSFRSGLSGF